MKLSAPILLLVLAITIACSEGRDGGGALTTEAFCGPVLARVDSFMASVAGGENGGERYGGTAVVGTVAELNGGMNAFKGGDAGSVQHQMFVNMMTLVQYDENLEPVPYLARSWELSDEGRKLTFRLRDDVFWHDGEPTTAYDVAFTYATAANPASGFPNPGFFQYYIDGPESVEVVDSFTVSFRILPHADYMDPWRTVAIMPRHLLGDVPPEELATHPFGSLCPVGNGPFRFLAHYPKDRWIFAANPAFPVGLGGRPYLDRYVDRIIPDETTLLTEFLTGGIDVYVAMLPQNAQRARDAQGLRIVSFPYRSVFFVAWNSRVPKLSNPKVRRALTVGINRRAIMEGVRGHEALMVNSGVPPAHWAYDPSLEDSLPYDPALARVLLDESGWTDRDGDGVRENEAGEPFRISLLTSDNGEWREVGEIMQAQLRDVGIDLRIRVMEFGALVDLITAPERDFDAILVSFETEFRLEERDLFHSEAAEGPLAFSGTQDSVLDRYLDTLQLMTDRAEALPLWRAYQERIIALQPYTYLYSAFRLDGVNERLRDVVMDARGEWVNLRDWWIAPEDRKTP